MVDDTQDTKKKGAVAADLVFAGEGVDPTLEHLDRVALSIAVKDSLYQKLL